MTMQTDVKAVHTNASTTVVNYRTRVKGFSICGVASQAGTLQLKDGGSGGTVMLEVDIPANTNPNSFYTLIPGQGIVFQTNVYVALTSIASVTLYYG